MKKLFNVLKLDMLLLYNYSDDLKILIKKVKIYDWMYVF